MNKFLNYFKLTKKYRGIKPFKCTVKGGLNILVGENGSGKSTILQLLATGKKEDYFTYGLTPEGKGTPTAFLDTEKQNPRFQNISYTKNIGYAIASHFSSHGETMLPLVKACQNMSNKVIFIDEPEAGISLSNQKKILRAFKESEKNGCQIIVATHSYVIIKNVKEVFCLDNRKWIPSKDYLK